MDANNGTTVYEMSISMCVGWQAHSLSNAGNNGSNRMLPRRQFLADGTITDACSGNIAKHHHAVLLAEYFEETGSTLCSACAARDGRRAGALPERDGDEELSMERILRGCALCDAHGFLVVAKGSRPRLSKHSLIEFSYALARPDRHAESLQMMTRSGASKEDGQMLMQTSIRSGEYAVVIRYRGVGVGVDTDAWRLVEGGPEERRRRHRAILSALRDCILSPDGAQTATTLPHLTGLTGAIVVRSSVGRAPIYSPLIDGFVEQLRGMAGAMDMVYSFETAAEFSTLMQWLIDTSDPCLPASGRS
jgi:CRISPR-associated autoregulator DevR family